METVRNTFRVVAIIMFLFYNSVSMAMMESYSVSKAITDFCNERASIEDRSFCLQVFKSDPRSRTANDFLTILKIAVDSAVDDASRTRNILVGISQKNGIQVLKVCISTFDTAVIEWHSMVREFKDHMSTYDGEIAFDELTRCNKLLTDSKISEPEISSRLKVAFAHCHLNEYVAYAAEKH